jgi:hypothetical protein
LIKHVASVEESWANFIVGGAQAMAASCDADWMAGFEMRDPDTLASLLERYAQVAARTDEIVATLPDLNADQPLPEAPWFQPGAR